MKKLFRVETFMEQESRQPLLLTTSVFRSNQLTVQGLAYKTTKEEVRAETNCELQDKVKKNCNSKACFKFSDWIYFCFAFSLSHF